MPYYHSLVTTILASIPLPLLAQGSLTPPSEALDESNNPQPHMKTLNQLESRIDIASLSSSNSNFLHEIASPGSYFLSSNLVTNKGGILISSDNVTLDLNGFTIETTSSATYYAIHSNGVSSTDLNKNITIKNGHIQAGGNSIYISNTANASIHNLSLYKTGTGSASGIRFAGTCSGGRVWNISANKFYRGLELDGNTSGVRIWNSSFTKCTNSGIMLNGEGATKNVSGNTIEKCQIEGNNFGIYLTARTAGGRSRGNLIRNNNITNNTQTGIYGDANGGGGGSVSGNVIIGNHLAYNHAGGSKYACFFHTGGTNIFTGNTLIDNTIYTSGSIDTEGPTISKDGTLGTSGNEAHPHANLKQ